MPGTISASKARVAMRLVDQATMLEGEASLLRAKTAKVRRVLWSADHERADIEANKLVEFATWLRGLAADVKSMEEMPPMVVPLQVEGGVAARDVKFEIKPVVDQRLGQVVAAEMTRAMAIESGSDT